MDGILLGKVRSFFFRVAIVATIGSLSLPTISKIFEYRKRKRRKKYLKSVYHSVQLENCWKRGMESYWKRICSFFFNWKRRGEEEMQLTSCDRSHHRFILFPLSSLYSLIKTIHNFENIRILEEEEKEEISEICLS